MLSRTPSLYLLDLGHTQSNLARAALRLYLLLQPSATLTQASFRRTTLREQPVPSLVRLSATVPVPVLTTRLTTKPHLLETLICLATSRYPTLIEEED